MNTPSKGRPAVFVDRDGTLIREVDHLSNVKDLSIYSFTDAALALLRDAGFLIVVVTNQSGIGRGYFTERSMHDIHAEISSKLDEKIDGFYFCPHRPEDGCLCRKPRLGMIEAACADHEIDLARSWMIGDKRIDVETGQNADVRTALVLTGYGADDLGTLTRQPDVIGDDLLAVATKIVAEVSASR
jgi:D-glycero-D-manno-heptose 1,7-bisphosphate phosphatase